MKSASLIAAEVVKMTTRSAASDKSSSKWHFSVWHNTNLHNTATNAALTTNIAPAARPAAASGDNTVQLIDVDISVTWISTGVMTATYLLVDMVVVTSKFILIYIYIYIYVYTYCIYCITLSFWVKRNTPTEFQNKQTNRGFMCWS